MKNLEVFEKYAALQVEWSIPIRGDPQLVCPSLVLVLDSSSTGWRATLDYARITANGGIVGIKGGGIVIGVVASPEAIVEAADQILALVP